jgi:hypothetical protein
MSASGPNTLSILFTLETKGMGRFLFTKGGKEAEDLENLLMEMFWNDFAQQKYSRA